jgi:c-di-GMP-binding flagellar brake protein YcgR
VYGQPSILHSTRALQTGDRIRLSVAYQHENGPIEARVNRVAEDFLEVELDKPVQTGDEVICVCFVEAGRYSFHSRVERTSSDGRKALLSHTTELKRRERRSSRRVEAGGTIYCRPLQDDFVDWQEMELVDLSEGGARFHGERVVIKGTDRDAGEQDARKMQVRFLPEDILPGEVDEEDMSKWILTSCRVVGVRHLGVDDYEYRVAFIDADRELQRTLSKILYLLETRNRG